MPAARDHAVDTNGVDYAVLLAAVREMGASSLRDDSIRVSPGGSGRVGTRRGKRGAFPP